MDWPRLGRVGYLNCLPLFYPLETGRVKLPARIVADHPAVLNKAFRQEELEVTAVSSLAYGQFAEDALVLPGLSISCRGRVGSVFLLSRVPAKELGGRPLSLTPYSATSVVLLRILLQRLYHVAPDFFTRPAGSTPDWGRPEALLTIGDEALQVVRTGRYPFVYDLGEEWYRLTGKPMVFALWVARKDFAAAHPEKLAAIWRALQEAKAWGKGHPGTLAATGARHLGVEPEFIEDYFALLNYDLDWPHLEGLLTFYGLAHGEGFLAHPVALEIWGGDNERNYRLQSA
ncbi:menaquinone biosynthetic enzyme MqnA/MqnD family protein [Neomoorella thermoacetica]|uniref:menaquinone biosynthetic enzyme MqnA/MqnD family protein n=1 Tax=Neomoorella thermoacetica TaxID=1525 RepID=UPI0008FB89AA|nr:menaquinone biosynthesis protein [Moorella thermoacetica]APC09070.1 chorismate dehydratase [Moorella thermoacetica]OIQ53124.1 chorismate dehydratase [Moorella thermoacetica]